MTKLQNNKMNTIKRLNLGAGNDIIEGFDNQDYKNHQGINLVFDLELKRYPIDNNTYDYILCNHVIEHINNIYSMFNELHRISKPHAIIKIEVPHYSVNFAYTQIDHKHYFGLDSLSILEESDFQNKTKSFTVITTICGIIALICGILVLSFYLSFYLIFPFLLSLIPFLHLL